MKISTFFCLVTALLFIAGFTTIGHAEEEGLLGKVKQMFQSETAESEKDIADSESEIESKWEESSGAESENLEARESSDVVESRDDVTLPSGEKYGEEEAEVVLKVDGMTCASCESAVKTALMNCAGVEDCEVSYINGEATVKVAKGSENTTEMINAVNKSGFTASAKLEENIQYGAEPDIKGTEESEATEEESQYQQKW